MSLRRAMVLALVTGLLAVGWPGAAQAGNVWQPSPGTTWQWQIQGKVRPARLDVQMFDLDLFDARPGQINAGAIEALHARGETVICYLDTGAWESYRPDSGRFPRSVIGRRTYKSDGRPWVGERWLDLRRRSWPKFAWIMWLRLDLARRLGCDGVEPDQNNPWGNHPGFPITKADQERWYLKVAQEAHRRGLSVGMKNGIETVDHHTVAAFDWALNEECFQYHECARMEPFIAAGKAVFQVEYRGHPVRFCPQARNGVLDAEEASGTGTLAFRLLRLRLGVLPSGPTGRIVAMVLGSVLLASCVGQSVEVPEAQPNIAPRACPSPQPDRRTFTAPQGGCLPATALAEYTCGSDATPMMVRFAAGTNERRYLGGSYRVPVDRLPGDARRIAVWGGRTQVFARRGDPAWLWVKDAEGLMRWLAIPRRASWSVSSPSPVATASASGSTDPSSAFFIGDSITDGASTFIASALPGWTVGFDAVIGRSSISGVDPVRAQAALDPPPDVVVVELGTNDQDVATFQRDVASILSATSGIPLVLWQTVHGPTPTRPRVNAAIRQGVAGTTNAALADWNAFVRKDQLSSDGIHPASDHEDLMALLVAPLLDDWRAAVQGEGPAACIGGTG